MRFPEDRWNESRRTSRFALWNASNLGHSRSARRRRGSFPRDRRVERLRLFAPLRPNRRPDPQRTCRPSAPSTRRKACSFSARSSRSCGIPLPPRDCSASHGSGRRERFQEIWAAENARRGNSSAIALERRNPREECKRTTSAPTPPMKHTVASRRFACPQSSGRVSPERQFFRGFLQGRSPGIHHLRKGIFGYGSPACPTCKHPIFGLTGIEILLYTCYPQICPQPDGTNDWMPQA